MGDQTILIVDDDPKIRTLLRNVLEGDGFAVHETASAAGVHKALAQGHIDLITLDINLGKDNGVDLAREIRRTSAVPIVMLSGKDDVIDRVVGLEVGADDYITKPFHIREVTARIRSVLRRSKCTGAAQVSSVEVPSDDHVLQFHFDGLTAIPEQLELLDRNNLECNLTVGDFKLLMIFLERPKRVLSRDQLLDLTGGTSWTPMDRTIDNQIARLRKQIERDPSTPKLIKTVRGVGYTLTCSVTEVHAPELGPSKA